MQQMPVAKQQVSNASNKMSMYYPASQSRTVARVKRREGYFEEPPHPEAWKRIKKFARCCSGILFDFQSYLVSTVHLSLFSNFEEDEKSRAVTLEVESMLVDAKHRNDTPEEKRKLLKRCNLLSVS